MLLWCKLEGQKVAQYDQLASFQADTTNLLFQTAASLWTVRAHIFQQHVEVMET